MQRRLLFIILTLSIGIAACANGTCVFTQSSPMCMVNYRKAACEESSARYEKLSGEAGVGLCKREGFTVAVGLNEHVMSDVEVKAALDKGDTITFQKPTASSPH